VSPGVRGPCRGRVDQHCRLVATVTSGNCSGNVTHRPARSPTWACIASWRRGLIGAPAVLETYACQSHIPVLSRFTSSSTCQPISLIIPAVIIHHSFTFSLQAQTYLFNKSFPPYDFFYLLDCIVIMGLTGPITLIILFLVSHFIFLFIPCGGLSWLPVSFLLHVKYTLSYRIVSYTYDCTI